MSFCRDLCQSPSYPACQVTCPQPFVDACNEPCVSSCGDSTAVVYPPPIIVTFLGPVLATCPQESIVGSSEPLGISSSVGYSGANLSGSSYSYRPSLGYGGLYSSKSLYSCRRPYTPGISSIGRGGSDPCSSRWLMMYGFAPHPTQQH